MLIMWWWDKGDWRLHPCCWCRNSGAGSPVLLYNELLEIIITVGNGGTCPPQGAWPIEGYQLHPTVSHYPAQLFLTGNYSPAYHGPFWYNALCVNGALVELLETGSNTENRPQLIDNYTLFHSYGMTTKMFVFEIIPKISGLISWSLKALWLHIVTFNDIRLDQVIWKLLHKLWIYVMRIRRGSYDHR